MSLQSVAWTRVLRTPGAVVFALLFAMDSLARATLATVLPWEALRFSASARNMSALYGAIGLASIAASLFIPALIRRYRPRWVYTLGAVLLIVAPILLATSTFAGFVAGLLLRTFAAACLLNVLNLYIMAYIRKRDLARSEPLRTFFSAGAWTAGPFLGIYLFQTVGPWAAYGLSAVCAGLLVLYFWRLRLEYGPALPPDQPARTNPLPSIPRFAAQPRLRLAWILNFGREIWWVTFFLYGPAYMAVMEGEERGALYSGLLTSSGTALLFITPAMGWIGRRIGLRRFLMAAFALEGLATLLVVVLFDQPVAVGLCLFVAAIGAVSLDSVCMVPFLRAVRARERPEMTQVFSMYRDVAGLAPPALFALLLTVAPLWSVFLAIGAAMFLCAWLARWIPRGM